MVMPERIRKISDGKDNEKFFSVPLVKTILQAKIKITTVRMAVARLELTSLTPILAKIAVKAAKKADNKENISQFIIVNYNIIKIFKTIKLKILVRIKEELINIF